MLRVDSNNLHSWKSLFRTTRASVCVLVLGGMALVLPDQTGDELIALSTMKVGPIPGLFVLQFALGSLAISAWYWARAALAARFGVDDALEARRSLTQTHRKAFDAVPRFCFLFGVVLSLYLVWRRPSWENVFSVASWAVPAYLLIRWRLAIASPRFRSAFVNMTLLRSRRHFRPWLRIILPRLRALLMMAPFGPTVAVPLLFLGLFLFFWGAVEGFLPWSNDYPGLPAVAARIFPGPSIALIIFALMIGPLTALIFVMDGLRLETVVLGRRVGLTRPPVIIGLLIWLLIAPVLFSLHSVRPLAADRQVMSVDQRATLADFFAGWAAACAPDPNLPARPIIVAISGGGTRAGIWGAHVLAAVDAAAGQRNAAVFGVSSVSGGSLGAAAYMAVMRATQARCVRAEDQPSQVREILDKVNNDDLGGDALGPLLAGAVLSDIPRALLSPAAAVVRLVSGRNPRGGDRAEALERAFEGLWLVDLRRSGLLDSGIPLFSASFLSLSYQRGKPVPGMPVWIVNGTDLVTGGRMLTAPFASRTNNDWPFRLTGDALGLLGSDVAISTAINNGARFPFMEPAGELISVKAASDQGHQHWPEVLDGAYFDNEGLLTALELAAWLKEQSWHGKPVEPVIVQVTADADIVAAAARASVVRCPDRPVDMPTDLPPTPATLQLVVPVIGLNHVRFAHVGVMLREARDEYCGAGDRRSFFHFYLFNQADRDIPLNWLLSPSIVAAIREQLMAGGLTERPDASGNDTEYRALFDTLHGFATAVRP